MDIDGPLSDQAQQTQLQQQFSVQHVCSHRCKVELMFGNVYRCLSSGQVHVCDQGCSQQVPQDRYSSVCRISKKVFHHAQPAVDASRKRAPCCSDVVRDQRKRGFVNEGALTEDVGGDAMVM